MRRRPPALETTGTVRPALGRAKPTPAQAGTTIIVGTSDTLETLSRRYNVSSAAILQANGYKGPRALSPGQQLIIPRHTAAVAASAAHAAVTGPRARVVAAPAAAAVHVVNRAIRCSASPVAITCRWQHSPRPTVSMPLPNSSSARKSPCPARRPRRSAAGAAVAVAAATPQSRRIGAPATSWPSDRRSAQSAAAGQATTKVEEALPPKRRQGQ